MTPQDRALPFDEALHAMCRDHGVAAVYLFDRSTRAVPGARSDPDVGLLFDASSPSEAIAPIPAALLQKLRAVFGADGLVVADVERMGPLQRYRATRGRMLYAAGAHRRARFEEAAFRDYQDFDYEMRLFDEERAEEIAHEAGGD